MPWSREDGVVPLAGDVRTARSLVGYRPRTGPRRSGALMVQARLAAHRISDFVTRKLTGERCFRLASPTLPRRLVTLWVADADGEGAPVCWQSQVSFRLRGRRTARNWPAYTFGSVKPVIYARRGYR
jgi:hypothetical protein